MSHVLAGLLLVSVMLSACSSVPMIPAKAHGQSAAQLVSDEDACAKETVGDPKRDAVYAACLIARGYTAYVVTNRVPLNVRALAPRARPVVVTDLETCDGAATRAEASESGGAKGGRIAGTVALALFFGPFALAASGPDAVLVTTGFKDCLEPKGYTVERWMGTTP